MKYTPPKVHAELVGDATTIVFDGAIENDAITGLFLEGEAGGTFSLRRVAAVPPAFSQEDVAFPNGDVSPAGTLVLPSSPGPHPAVVFLHGAGAEDRAGGRFFAAHFARGGFEDLAGDAIAGVHYLQQRSGISPRKIGVYGHSQSGILGDPQHHKSGPGEGYRRERLLGASPTSRRTGLACPIRAGGLVTWPDLGSLVRKSYGEGAEGV